jgi:hypothetical protein
MAAKLGQRQLSFVDGGLGGWAERVTGQTLVALLESLVADTLSAAADRQHTTAAAQKDVLRLIFHLFACRVLEDKGVIPPSTTPEDALTAAHDRFSENIRPEVLRTRHVSKAIVLGVYKTLQTRFAFSNLTTDMLGYAYENALVTGKLRKERGIYYTPRHLTSYILKILPIESIALEDRILTDPCCGSGSFLLAGFDRLTSLLPDGWTPAKRHQYLRARLIGNDIDDFATEVATLSLVVTDPENKNGWKVLNKDVLELGGADFTARPTIIVTNPPFKEVKVGSRRELAADILSHDLRLLAPDGLLGAVMPQSFLESRAAKELRATILRDCDLLEIATLPGGLFESNADTAVVALRKSRARAPKRTGASTVRELRSKDLTQFLVSGSFTHTYSVDTSEWLLDPDARFVLSPMADTWKRISGLRKLGDVADVRSGLQIERDDVTSLSEVKCPKCVPYIDRLDLLRPYALLTDVRPAKWLLYGDHLRRKANRAMFEQAKVVINSNRNPGTPWRLVAAPATANLYFSDNFHGLITRDDATSLAELLAVLNSPIANAWFDAHCRKRKVVQSILEELPYPKFSAQDRSELEKLVRQLERATIAKWRSAREGLFYDAIESTDTASLLAEIDAKVYEGYGLMAHEVRAISRYMSAEKRPA